MKLISSIAIILVAATASAADISGYGLSVLVNDVPRAEYHARGSVYVEALKGEEYALRITNPTPYRVAVALSVDGLNTVDAKHTSATRASKWVLGPYETATITGWQVNDSIARRFFFTGEHNSYAAALGQTNNLGVIEAVFYREKHREISVYAPRKESTMAAPPPAAPEARAQGNSAQAQPSDDYAATGMGQQTSNEVQLVDIDLEPAPIATIRLRYEFRPELIRLGVLTADPMQRRERAQGFCPQPTSLRQR